MQMSMNTAAPSRIGAAGTGVPGVEAAQAAADERAIRALIEAHAAARNRRDLAAAAAVYADTASIALRSGKQFSGLAGVEQWHAEALGRPDVRPHVHPPETIRVRIISADIAIADMETHSPGGLDADGLPCPPRKAPLFIVLVKSDGEWRITAQRPTTLPVK